MSKKLNITVLVDAGEIRSDDPQFLKVPKEPITEYHVIEALRTLDFNVSVLGAGEDITAIVSNLSENKPDLVFNLTEHVGGDRKQDKNIASVLELLSIPFTGAGPAGLMLCRDKTLCKQLLNLHKIRVPGFVKLAPNRSVRVPKALQFPLVVKPAFEDSSEGIANASIVNNEAALSERARFIHERWDQPAIAEEYIEGRELYVGILGNKRLTMLPVRECFFSGQADDGPSLATYRVKWNAEYRKKWNIEFGFAALEEPVLKDIERICKRTYRALQIRDYGRIDLRLTETGKVVVLEANPNPDLAYGEEVAEAAERGGISYEKLINRIVRAALMRYR